MFSRPIGRSGSTSCGRAELDPDPAARWVRFVFNSLRQNDSTGEEVRFHYEEPRRGVPFPWHDIYGYATLPNGFFAASARAIELANLLPAEVATATPEASPSIAPQSTAAGRPTADILDVTHPQENHPQVPDGGKNSKPMSSDTTGGAVRNEFAELLAAAEGLGVKGKELLVIKRIVHGQGSVTIADLGSACCWPNPDGNWNSMRRRLNKKLGPKCWELFRQDNEAKARKLAQPKRNQAKKSTAPKTDQARGRK